MERHALYALLQERTGPLAASILAEVQPAVRLSRQIIADDTIPVGTSKMGGRPDLSPRFVWPGRNNIAHSFLAQLTLAEVAPHDAAHLLPSSGRLYFFYGISHEASGFDPDDRGSWAVVYDDSPVSDLVRTDPPPSLVALDVDYSLLTNGLYVSSRLIPQATWTLPDQWSERGREFTRRLDQMSTSAPREDDEEDDGELAEEDDPTYAGAVARSWASIPGPWHQMLGYPALVQNDMELECQLVSHGIYFGDGTWQTDPRTPALEAGARDWLLLLQVDTDEEANMEWGDSARLYFWIEQHALAERRFSNVWCIYQSH